MFNMLRIRRRNNLGQLSEFDRDNKRLIRNVNIVIEYKQSWSEENRRGRASGSG